MEEDPDAARGGALTIGTAEGAEWPAGFGISERSQLRAPREPKAKMAITARLPYRNEELWKGAATGFRLCRRTAAWASNIFSKSSTAGVGGREGELLGCDLSSMDRKTVAYTAPFLVFMLFIGVSGALERAHVAPEGMSAMYLIFPVQTVASAATLAWFWRQYRLRAPLMAWVGILAGVLSFAVWVAPQAVLHEKARVSGFDPQIFAGQPAIYWGELTLRFLRLVVVVPLLEEIFWRGFLLRYLVNEEFDAVPFGTYRAMANWVVVLGFMLEHSMQDWPAALVTGVLYNVVAFRTRSLPSCVLAHAVTNGLLGAYIMATHQWGFW